MHINDFPTELLEEVFLCSISQSQHLYSPPSICCRRSSAGPTSQICRRWRDIALNFAPLWTHLHVVDPQDVNIVQDLEVWIRRARTLPLCLSFRQYTSYDLEASVAVVRLFLNLHHRCQSFEMFVSTDLKEFCLGNIKKVPSTTLESVNVCCFDQRWKWKDAKWLTILLLNSDTRSLRTIRWSCGFSGALIPHSWEHLRELEIDSVGTLPEFINALSHCQNLERLKIHAVAHHPFEPIFVTLPRVTHLSVLPWCKLKAIFRMLVLPSLVELEIVLSYRLAWAWSPVVDLMKRSGMRLRRLGIINRDSIPTSRFLDQVELVGMLKNPYFQDLRILEIEAPMMAGHLIVKFLTLRNTLAGGGDEYDGASSYLVHLERICLVFQGKGGKLLQALRKLIKSRLGVWKSVSEHTEITTQLRFSLSIPST